MKQERESIEKNVEESGLNHLMGQLDNITLQGVVKFLVGVAITATVIFLLWYFSEVVIYILVSAILAIIFHPMVKVLTQLKVGRRHITRNVASAITLFTIWALFALVFSAIVPLVSMKITQLTNLDIPTVLKSIETPIQYLQHKFQELFSMPESSISINESITAWITDSVDFKTLNSAFSSVVGILASFVITFFSVSFITFFFLKDDKLFFSMVAAVFPSQYDKNVNRALSSVKYLLSRYFVGLVCESAMITTAVSLAMICFGMKSSDAIFIGIVMGVMNVIPYAGPFIGACFSVFLGIITPIESFGVVNTVIAIVCSLMVIKGMDDFLLQPTLYSERVKAHPLEVFIVMLMAGYVGGVVGMLLAIPSYTVLRVFAKEFFSQYSLVRKLTKEL
ncbi:MAG: AI-2E family transporter [Rikenellaceae bacterium]